MLFRSQLASSHGPCRPMHTRRVDHFSNSVRQLPSCTCLCELLPRHADESRGDASRHGGWHNSFFASSFYRNSISEPKLSLPAALFPVMEKSEPAAQHKHHRPEASRKDCFHCIRPSFCVLPASSPQADECSCITLAIADHLRC